MSGGNGRDAILQERHIVEVKLSDLPSEFLFDLSLTLQSPFGHWAGARRSPPDRHDFWRSFPGAAAIGHCSATHGRGLAPDPVGWNLRSRRAGLLLPPN
jgi:hypothetical protein